MESSKYYTPKITEFHEGFEYEIKDPLVRDYDREFTDKKDWLGYKISEHIGDYWKIDFGWKKRIYSLLTSRLGEHSISKDDYHWQLTDNMLQATLAEIRVKYLDKEDIESLGFKLDKTTLEGETQWKFFKNNLCLFYRPKTKELGTFTVDPSKNDYMLKHNRDNKMISFLTIKNKSELKKLLKQLNIQ